MARTLLASWPMAGRSSAESLPICFRMTVSSPFLPRYLTRSASSAATSAAPRRRLSGFGAELFELFFHFAFRLPLSILGPTQAKKSPPSQTGRKALFRGTTRIRRSTRRTLRLYRAVPAGVGRTLRGEPDSTCAGGLQPTAPVLCAPFRVIFPFTAIKYLQLEYIYSTTLAGSQMN